MGAADPLWAVRPPEANDLILKAGSGVATMVANEGAWVSLGATHHAAGVASTVNTAATSASWIGAGGASSALTATQLNVAMHGLAGWVDIKPAVVAAAMAAYELATMSMRTAAECEENRVEWSNDNAINPLVFGALTPRIVSLDMTYFGYYWPNNAAVGTTYGATLSALTASLAVPPPPAGLGASPAAPAQAASALAQAGGETAAENAIGVAHEGASAAGGQGASTMGDAGGQVNTLLGPMQQAVSAVPQAAQGAMKAPMDAVMGPAQSMQSMMGMFMGPGAGALGAGGAPGGAVAAGATPGAASVGGGGAVGGGGGAVGGGGGAVPASSFTRPVSAFEPGSAGRPVGLRPSGALGMPEGSVRPATSVGGGGMGMPLAHMAGAGRGTGESKNQSATTAQIVR